MSIFISTRSTIEPFRVMQIAGAADERQRSHGDAILMCVGQPATGAPKPVIDAVTEAVQTQPLGYTPTLGMPELRAEIARWHSETYGVATEAKNVVITTGSSGGFVALFLAALDHGDPIAMTRPGYPAYRNTLQALGAQILELECGEDTRFQPNVEKLEALSPTPRALIVTSPDNPSGTIIDAGELERIAKWCEENDCLLISDEIYHGISYGRECATARAYSDKAVVVGSLSKFFSMTGWRLGWLIVPDELVPPLDSLLGNLALCPPAVSQVAGLAAFGEEARTELESHVAKYTDARDVLLRRLPKMGLGHFAPPDGGFYLYVDVSELCDKSEEFARELLEATGLAIAPGIDFDPVDGHKYVRFSFCLPVPLVEEACDRLEAFLAAYRR